MEDPEQFPYVGVVGKKGKGKKARRPCGGERAGADEQEEEQDEQEEGQGDDDDEEEL